MTVLFTENETNTERLYQTSNESPFVKDAFHDAVLKNDFKLFENKKSGTKCSPVFSFNIEPCRFRYYKITFKQRFSCGTVGERI